MEPINYGMYPAWLADEFFATLFPLMRSIRRWKKELDLKTVI